MSQEIKDLFAQEVSGAEAQINLAHAALLFAEYLTQPIDRSFYLALLDEMAEAVRPAVAAAGAGFQIIEALNHYLFVELKFLGNKQDYYQVDNSFLNKVLELKTGIPISLSVIYLEIGRRLNLPLWGVGLPGHFIVGYGLPAQPIYLDVFNQGAILSEDDCLVLCRVGPTQRLSFRERFLQPVSKKAILFRMLLNLKHIYLGQELWSKAYQVVGLMLLIYPGQADTLKERGLLAYRLGRLHDALFDLKRYVFLSPESQEREQVTEWVKIIEEELARLN
jgi:regulator of sirC expression with transglutaminase-like and TPR domain